MAPRHHIDTDQWYASLSRMDAFAFGLMVGAYVMAMWILASVVQ